MRPLCTGATLPNITGEDSPTESISSVRRGIERGRCSRSGKRSELWESCPDTVNSTGTPRSIPAGLPYMASWSEPQFSQSPQATGSQHLPQNRSKVINQESVDDQRKIKEDIHYHHQQRPFLIETFNILCPLIQPPEFYTYGHSTCSKVSFCLLMKTILCGCKLTSHYQTSHSSIWRHKYTIHLHLFI